MSSDGSKGLYIFGWVFAIFVAFVTIYMVVIHPSIGQNDKRFADEVIFTSIYAYESGSYVPVKEFYERNKQNKKDFIDKFMELDLPVDKEKEVKLNNMLKVGTPTDKKDTKGIYKKGKGVYIKLKDLREDFKDNKSYKPIYYKNREILVSRDDITYDTSDNMQNDVLTDRVPEKYYKIEDNTNYEKESNKISLKITDVRKNKVILDIKDF